MKTTQRIMTTVLLWIAMFGGTAHAATTTKIYSSGVLVIGFLALCALVLVVQLIPAIMTVVGMIKGAAHKKEVESYK
jgi:hypothetical protein